MATKPRPGHRMGNRDTKIVPEKTWVASTHVGKLVLLTIAATTAVLVFHFRMAAIEVTMDRDIATRTAERKADELARQQERESDRIARSQEKIAFVTSMNELRDELRKVFIDSVATRQAQAWIELARLHNKERRPDVIFPDLPR